METTEIINGGNEITLKEMCSRLHDIKSWITDTAFDVKDSGTAFDDVMDVISSVEARLGV